MDRSIPADFKLVHICEVCGRTENLTPREAYDEGWDYPPVMGAYGIVSPRTCPNCRMVDTVWAELVLKKKQVEELTSQQRQALMRILAEPDSIIPH